MDKQVVANSAGFIFSAFIVAIGICIERSRKKREKRAQLSSIQQYTLEYRPTPVDDRLPTIAGNGFELVDIVESAGSIDYSNPLPSLSEKSSLSIGDLVKLKFLNHENEVERMWVEIADRQGDFFKGILANYSILFSGLANGGEIWFHANHIFEVQEQ